MPADDDGWLEYGKIENGNCDVQDTVVDPHTLSGQQQLSPSSRGRRRRPRYASSGGRTLGTC